MKIPYAGKPVTTGRPRDLIPTKYAAQKRVWWARKRAAIALDKAPSSAYPGSYDEAKR